MIIAKSCGVLALFYGVYVLFLSRETYYETNRRFLNAGILISILLPFMVFTNEKWIAINADDLMKMDVGRNVHWGFH